VLGWVDAPERPRDAALHREKVMSILEIEPELNGPPKNLASCSAGGTVN
jgi:hypothetical protein